MNRSLKRHQQSQDKARPSRQRYRPLNSCDDVECDIYHDVRGQLSENAIELQSTIPEHFVEKVVEPGDTLLTISLQFNCPVAELKRVNQIIRDNEIFARRVIKVPIKPGSYITEILAQVHSNGGTNEHIAGSTKTSTYAEGNVNKNEDICSNTNKTTSYFGTLNLQDILKNEIVSSVPSTSFSEDRSLDIDDGKSTEDRISKPLLLQGNTAEETNNGEQVFKCSGADCGLSWWQLVSCALLLGCAGPLLYVLYIVEKQHTN